jgi:hypothetical protein
MRTKEQLIQLRPQIQREATEFSAAEQFQNEVLRPVLKFQHELFLHEWQENPIFQPVQKANTIEERRQLLAKLFSKQTPYIQRLVGMIVGLFTQEEYQFYLKEKVVLDKRIRALLITRLLSYS